MVNAHDRRSTPMPAPRRPDLPAALPGFSAPAAGFDEPLAMLDACHERVRRSLDLLLRINERVEAGRVDEAVQRAAADVLRYFDIAAPQHHEDEEQHIFPRLLAGSADPDVRAAILQLQEDHLWMEAQWGRLRTSLAGLATGHVEAYGREHAEAARLFAATYGAHLVTEDTVVLPAAAALLDAEALRAMGLEMARRRGARFP
jgi:hemerythrin-like domain-containing protein